MGLSLEDTSFAKYYRKEGMEEGLAKGIEKGKAEGLAEGMEKGKAEGLEEGEKQKRLKLLRNYWKWIWIFKK